MNGTMLGIVLGIVLGVPVAFGTIGFFRWLHRMENKYPWLQWPPRD